MKTLIFSFKCSVSPREGFVSDGSISSASSSSSSSSSCDHISVSSNSSWNQILASSNNSSPSSLNQSQLSSMPVTGFQTVSNVIYNSCGGYNIEGGVNNGVGGSGNYWLPNSPASVNPTGNYANAVAALASHSSIHQSSYSNYVAAMAVATNHSYDGHHFGYSKIGNSSSSSTSQLYSSYHHNPHQEIGLSDNPPVFFNSQNLQKKEPRSPATVISVAINDDGDACNQFLKKNNVITNSSSSQHTTLNSNNDSGFVESPKPPNYSQGDHISSSSISPANSATINCF